MSCLVLLLAVVGCGARMPLYPLAVVDGDELRIPCRELADGSVHFYSVELEGTRVNFLVRTDARGALHTHFDACHSCYRYHRGFVVDGGDLVCVACRYRYAVAEEEWDFIGACAPITFHSIVDGDSLVIGREVLEKGRRFFS